MRYTIPSHYLKDIKVKNSTIFCSYTEMQSNRQSKWNQEINNVNEIEAILCKFRNDIELLSIPAPQKVNKLYNQTSYRCDKNDKKFSLPHNKCLKKALDIHLLKTILRSCLKFGHKA